MGVAEALGLPYQTKRISYNKWARLPNRLLGSELFHVRRDTQRIISPPWPSLVIASGRRTVAVARYIKRKSSDPVFIAQIMWPGSPTKDLDLVSAPLHDEIRNRDQVVSTLGAPHNITGKRLQEGASAWAAAFASLNRPRIALLVGGDTRRTKFSSEMAGRLARESSAIVRSLGGSLMVSTSRRTSAEAVDALMYNLDRETQIFKWNADGRRNPYLGFLALSEAVIVTGDSMSMCTESCSTGRPVFIYAPPGLSTKKHRRLHQALYDYGAAKPFPNSSISETLINWSYAPINDAGLIADEIRRRLGPGLVSSIGSTS